MSMWCKVEFDNIHQVNGEFLPLKVQIATAKPAILKCYSGDHGLCSDHSHACNGALENNWIVKSTFNHQQCNGKQLYSEKHI